MRGLKPLGYGVIGNAPVVAPFTGAWIETMSKEPTPILEGVAPFTGAWIETPQDRQRSPSAPVAPFTGAWIETLQRYAY